jgi:sterol desaturase/sphingolipid hydroxylase (fatty acid hydroxylase superfamily)
MPEESIVAIGGVDWSQWLLVFTLCAFAVLMLLEMLVPRRQSQSSLGWRWVNNFMLSGITWYVSSAAMMLYVFALARQTQIMNIGLVPKLGLGTIPAFVILLLVSQLISYGVHVAFHKVSWLWPFHAIHHTDVDVDVSTSYRHHPLEPLLSLPLVTPVILLLGIPMEVAVVFKVFEISLALFSHSNIRLPEKLDSVLRKIILTPDFHRLHHSSEQRFTDSNYGSMVPWFDYLFGTASRRPYAEQETMELGLETLRQPRDSRLDRMLIEPFRRQRTRAGST